MLSTPLVVAASFAYLMLLFAGWAALIGAAAWVCEAVDEPD